MPTIISGDIVAVTFETFFNGQQCLNTFHYRYDLDSGTTEDASIAIAALASRLNGVNQLFPSYAACLVAMAGEIKTYMQVIFSVRYIKNIVDNDHDVGQLEETPLPQNLAGVITLRGDFAGRMNIGNKHITGIPVIYVEEGIIQPDMLALYTNLASAATEKQSEIVVGTNTFSFTPVIFHRANPLDSAVITNFIVQDTVRVMRRRTVRVGS